jgi:hypothetical protein
MSTVIYNGVSLLRCQELEFIRTPQWQGPDYLWTTYRLRVRGIYNPQVNAFDFSESASPTGTALEYQFPFDVLATSKVTVPRTSSVNGAARLTNMTVSQAVADPPPIAVPVSPLTPPRMARTVNAPKTDLAIRHKLLQARAYLVYAVGNTPILVSPTINASSGTAAVGSIAGNPPGTGLAAPVDAYVGPTPLAADVVAISGTKSFLVDFTIETALNEAYLYANPNSVLLSHRWQASEDVDQDYYSMRIIRGQAQFRSDRLAFLGAMPDDFRVALFHPLPGPGWKRTAVNVTPDPDGTSLTYTLVDKQLALSIIPAGVTRIEAWQTMSGNSFALESLAKGLAKGAMDFFSFGGASRESDISLGTRFAKAGFGLIGSLIPLTQIEVTAKVWGRSDILRNILQNVAIGIVLNRTALALDPNAIVTGSSELDVTHDLAGSLVIARGSLVTALTTAPYKFGMASATGYPGVGIYFPDDNDNTLPYLTERHANVTPLGLPLRPIPGPNATGTRGTFISRLATAALLAQDATPINPPVIMPSNGAVLDRLPP